MLWWWSGWWSRHPGKKRSVGLTLGYGTMAQVVDFVKLNWILLRHNSQREEDLTRRQRDWDDFRDFVLNVCSAMLWSGK